jgi:hypothetical protein
MIGASRKHVHLNGTNGPFGSSEDSSDDNSSAATPGDLATIDLPPDIVALSPTASRRPPLPFPRPTVIPVAIASSVIPRLRSPKSIARAVLLV